MAYIKNYGGRIDSTTKLILNQSHTLIAGTTGSGKSVLLNNLIYSILHYHSNDKQFLLFDPKKVELYKYRNTPHCIGYADNAQETKQWLNSIIKEMDNRYKDMRKQGQVKSTQAQIYIVIDELADLLQQDRRNILPKLIKISQIGRACNISILACTQRSTKQLLSGDLMVNIDCRIALHLPSAQDSRNIIYCNGAELLPRFGKGIIVCPDLLKPSIFDIAKTSEEQIQEILHFYENQKPKGIRKLFA